ncbi:hypothetical protein M413DRAFT_369566 [Hebeloma cylindrosporum]|uniref:Uncharacterized protein n=1 Tax=Hebeloma cylindrosporum TaxID=76867 RepID=A0A0C3BSK4_HEBCY|nr:hypothetical protein M413DRAFT_369566 [Hebeloma cylindrosporum h7]
MQLTYIQTNAYQVPLTSCLCLSFEPTQLGYTAMSSHEARLSSLILITGYLTEPWPCPGRNLDSISFTIIHPICHSESHVRRDSPSTCQN